MNKRLLFLVIVSSMLLLVCSGGAFAAGVVSGTVVTAEGSQNYVDYTDIAGNTKATVYGPTLEATVMAIYGFAGIGAPVDGVRDPNVEIYYSYTITNNGNTTDVYSLSKSLAYSGIYGSGWTTAFYLDANNDGAPDGGVGATISSITLAEEQQTYFLLRVVPAADAGSGSSLTVTVTAETASRPAGLYTGADGNPYGGVALANDAVTTLVQAPTMLFTRVATVDAPNGFNQNSDDHYPVPGSVVTITMTYTNEGSGSAESCIILDRVPTGHQGGHVNAASLAEIAAVTAGQGTATGWVVFYTTEAGSTPSNPNYGDAGGWLILGTIESDANYWTKDTTPALPLTATFIKWEKAKVEPNESETLTWGYIIR